LISSDQSPDQNYNLCGTIAGHMESPCGPHAARGPRVGQHCPRFKEACARERQRGTAL